ncbi:MAG TPA: threonine synthase, partial [Pseudomonadales bacterium]
CISGNDYSKGTLEPTLSPSMDIMVSSNFERFLYDAFESDTRRVSEFVAGGKADAQKMTDAEWARVRAHFSSHAVDDAATCETIRKVHAKTGFLLDPHSATGVKAAEVCDTEPSIPMITLATAHPAKFSAAIERAGLQTPALPPHMADLFSRHERCTVLDANLDAVKQQMQKTLGSRG